MYLTRYFLCVATIHERSEDEIFSCGGWKCWAVRSTDRLNAIRSSEESKTNRCISSCIYFSCPDKNELSYLESNAVSQAVRFKFPIRQYFGIAEQFLFIHFKVTICRRKQPPKMTAINCKTLAQFCPHRREETIMTVGPFVVLPEEGKQDKEIRLTNGYWR